METMMSIFFGCTVIPENIRDTLIEDFLYDINDIILDADASLLKLGRLGVTHCIAFVVDSRLMHLYVFVRLFAAIPELPACGLRSCIGWLLR